MRFVDARGDEYIPTRFLAFDDVLLQPQSTTADSRNDPRISLATEIGSSLELACPVISANMDTITSADMAIAMDELGCMGILHRYYKTKDDYKNDVDKIIKYCQRQHFSNKKKHCIGISIGCKEEDIYKADAFMREIKSNNFETYGSFCFPICIDVAHGHMSQSIFQIEQLCKLCGNYDRVMFPIVAGNIATSHAAYDLIEAGAGILKVNIGNGGICTTRMVTGHGVPVLTAIMQVREAIEDSGKNIGLIADGGIRRSGDIVKALAAGADAVMIGRLLAGTNESPGEIIEKEDRSYKVYRGQSSRHFLDDIKKSGVAAEGEMTHVPVTGPVRNIINDLMAGVRSGFTYSGAFHQKELREVATFIEISQHGYIEGTPHGVDSLNLQSV